MMDVHESSAPPHFTGLPKVFVVLGSRSDVGNIYVSGGHAVRGLSAGPVAGESEHAHVFSLLLPMFKFMWVGRST